MNDGDALGDRVVTTFSSRKLNQLSFVFVEQNTILRRICGITFVYLDARQTTAVIEDSIPNAGDAAGDRHARHTTAVIEGSFLNACDAAGDRNARHTTAVIEGTIPNPSDAVANRHARQTTAVFEGPTPNAGDAVANGHACQAPTSKEGGFPNADDAVGDCHARQITAAIEGFHPNLDDRFSPIGRGNHQLSTQNATGLFKIMCIYFLFTRSNINSSRIYTTVPATIRHINSLEIQPLPESHQRHKCNAKKNNAD